MSLLKKEDLNNLFDQVYYDFKKIDI
jgi:hypothetical protein